MIEAGKARSLAVMSAQRNPQFASVPTLKETIGSDWTLNAWRGLAGPKGMSKEVVDKLLPLLKKIHDSAEFKDFMNQRGFGMVWAAPAEFATFMDKDNESLGKVMKAVGIAK